MLGDYSEYIRELYDRADSILIIDQNGYVEYSATYNQEKGRLAKDDYIGMHIMQVYPELTKETSTHFRVMKTKLPIINEEQTLTDLYGNTLSFINSSFPIIVNDGEPLGTIELSILISKNNSAHGTDKSNSSDSIHRDSLYTVDSIITSEPSMIDIKKDILRFSGSVSNALVWGETGTGKELVVESLHGLSPISSGPFISVNCSAMPSALVESLLFGTTKGSFTGAQDKQGFIEMANGGTLFLDELNSMNIDIQPKLLQVIERQKVRRIGATTERNVQVRFIAAMNEDPEQAIKDGILRRDLYYRLNIIEFHIPPLRERPNDIPILVQHFIRQCNLLLNKHIRGLSPIADNIIKSYPFAGNVRELKNVIEYAVNRATGDMITIRDLPPRIIELQERQSIGKTVPSDIVDIPSDNFSLQDHLDGYEKALILKALSENSSITAAANSLGLSRQALRYKIQKHDIKINK